MSTRTLPKRPGTEHVAAPSESPERASAIVQARSDAEFAARVRALAETGAYVVLWRLLTHEVIEPRLLP